MLIYLHVNLQQRHEQYPRTCSKQSEVIKFVFPLKFFFGSPKIEFLKFQTTLVNFTYILRLIKKMVSKMPITEHGFAVALK